MCFGAETVSRRASSRIMALTPPPNLDATVPQDVAADRSLIAVGADEPGQLQSFISGSKWGSSSRVFVAGDSGEPAQVFINGAPFIGGYQMAPRRIAINEPGRN